MSGPTAKRRPATGGSGVSGRSAASREEERNEVLEWVKSFGIAVLLFFVIRTFLIQAFTIPSGSMEMTLRIGDYLMANNAIYGAQIPFTSIRVPAFRDPRFGDVVVFRPTYNDPIIDVVKRVIGEPGDTIQMLERVVYRNGDRLVEPYVEPNYLPDEPMQRFGVPSYQWHLEALPENVNRQAYTPTRDSWGPVIVPGGHYMLLGDNRDQSLDSRFMGFIPREVIRGKALFIYYSIDPFANRPFPRFLTAVRWERLGMIIR
ncbi:MAG TPA: signal peptidase I [Longimicrobiaceae bacterium]|nr:signal peptidase I [Longimicrobiaceae bacterium]